MAATTIPTTTTRPNHPHLSRRFAAAMAALALAGAVTAGVMIVEDDDSTSSVPSVVQPSAVDKDAVRLQNSRSLSGAQPVDKDAIRLQNLQSIDSSPAGSSTVELRFGPA